MSKYRPRYGIVQEGRKYWVVTYKPKTKICWATSRVGAEKIVGRLLGARAWKLEELAKQIIKLGTGLADWAETGVSEQVDGLEGTNMATPRAWAAAREDIQKFERLLCELESTISETAIEDK